MVFDGKRALIICLICVLVSMTAMCAFAAKKSKIVILPFKINAEKDISFLRNGIFDMLSSRLATDDRISLTDREETENAVRNIAGPPDAKISRGIGIETKADYVIFGSLTVFGESASIDASVIDVKTGESVLSFIEQCRELGEVIPKIGIFASAVTDSLFKDDTRTEPVLASEKTPMLPVVESPVTETTGKDDGLKTAVSIRHQELSSDVFKIAWKSREMKTIINGIASGDVDNDGKNEIILIVPNEVWVYRFEGQRYQKIKEIESGEAGFLIGVDTADMNQNGYSEIFVTGLDAGRDDVRSFALEWNGKGFSRIVKNSPYYYRVMKSPDKKPVLIGQKGKSEGPFFGDIREMVWRDSDYVPNENRVAGKKYNALGLAFGNARNDGVIVTAAYTDSDHLEISDPAGGLIWKSDKKYGGNSLNYVLPGDLADEEKLQYLAVRIAIRDLDADGRNEIITIYNDEYLGRHMEAYRKFTDAQIVALFADGSIVTEGWKTQQISGRISDFVIADFDNDGKEELGAALIVKEKSILGEDATSVIVVYEFD